MMQDLCDADEMEIVSTTADLADVTTRHSRSSQGPSLPGPAEEEEEEEEDPLAAPSDENGEIWQNATKRKAVHVEQVGDMIERKKIRVTGTGPLQLQVSIARCLFR